VGKWNLNGTGALILSFAIAKAAFSKVLSVQEQLKEVPDTLNSGEVYRNDFGEAE
jgi:hypothetical protein